MSSFARLTAAELVSVHAELARMHLRLVELRSAGLPRYCHDGLSSAAGEIAGVQSDLQRAIGQAAVAEAEGPES